MRKLFSAILVLILVITFILYQSKPQIVRHVSNKILSFTFNNNKQTPSLSSENQDDITCFKKASIVGHLIVPNTAINYDVVQTINNKYFEHHDINGKNTLVNGKLTTYGAIFMDYRCNSNGLSKNTIIYGHNMKNGTGFKGLMKYKESHFFKENSLIYYGPPGKMLKWQIFSAYVTDTSFNYVQSSFKSEEEYKHFLASIKSKSRFTSNIKVTPDDYILTLSTCSYEFKGAKFVVHAKRITNWLTYILY